MAGFWRRRGGGGRTVIRVRNLTLQFEDIHLVKIESKKLKERASSLILEKK